ncbi:MAG: cell division protein FtsA [Bacteroidales bacterium]|nr:cell division protein FtsA [Bacteroidales bacterium]
MEERYIASVDLGTSKLAVCVARILGNDVQVIYYRETPSQGIRYSYVNNPGKVEGVLRDALTQAQQELKIKIQQVIVGLPRYYVRQESASASMIRTDSDSQIEESEVKTLKSMALEEYPLSDSKNEVIYGAVAQSFSTEDSLNELENDIVGMTAEKLEGNFKVFIGSRRHSINIDNVFNSMNIAIAKKYFTPGITARAVLKEEQMENGVALIDIGAGVSSVTIFKGKIMRYYAAIPFGGNSITRDIKTECNFSFDLAENIKRAYGACMPGKLSAMGEKSIQIVDENDEPTAQVTVKYISEIISARMKEIIEALLYHIQASGYASEDILRAGVVVTGGGAEIVNCANYIKDLSGYSVKIGYPRRFFSCEDCPEAGEASAATSMGMILAAKADKMLNCVNEAPARRFWTAPKPRPQSDDYRSLSGSEGQSDGSTPLTNQSLSDDHRSLSGAEGQSDGSTPLTNQSQSETKDLDEERAPEEPAIEASVIAAQEEEGPSVFDDYTPDEIKKAKDRKKERQKERKPLPKPKFTWFKHIQNTISKAAGDIFDDMENEEI